MFVRPVVHEAPPSTLSSLSMASSFPDPTSNYVVQFMEEKIRDVSYLPTPLARQTFRMNLYCLARVPSIPETETTCSLLEGITG